MRYRSTAVLLAGIMLSTAASAQDAASPDGTGRAFGIEPYVGLSGGYHDFDRDTSNRIPANSEGALVGGFAGINVPLGPLVAGVEGNVAKGFGNIDWEYGATGHLGFRAGETGQIFARAGYQWMELEQPEFLPEQDGNHSFRQREGVLYGVGFSVGPAEIGLPSAFGARFRVNVDTVEFESLRTTAGFLFHF